jgi:carboxyl-terminal processing protease
MEDQALSRGAWTAVLVCGALAAVILWLPTEYARRDALLRRYAALLEVHALVSQMHVDPPADEELRDGAIRGLVGRLDPYSTYLSPEEFLAARALGGGFHEGIGAEVHSRNGRLVLGAPVAGAPAERAGISAGTELITVDGRYCRGLSPLEAEYLLLGPHGSTVSLSIRDPDAGARQVQLVRERIASHAVRGHRGSPSGEWDHLIDPTAGIAYIRITHFEVGTADAFAAAVRRQIQDGCRGLVIDLRGNPGGRTEEAVRVVDCFVRKGVILTTVNRRRSVQRYLATGGPTWADLPLAVLIDSGSASSAEIVAGALQDLHRATIVGERSFGKGSVQHLIHLRTLGGAVRLTTGQYTLPSGRTFQGPQTSLYDGEERGIAPDVCIPLNAESARSLGGEAEVADPQLRAALDLLRDRITPTP